ncbi:Rep family protein, partial [Lactobacillus acidophilus]|uniref:Rep family protein n=1 Tax=Lactobacillus acidophilus TaxID=1579 RepID=UPI0030F1018C
MSRIAKLFNEQQQYVEVCHNNINNGYSYLIHETTNPKNKHHYDPSELVASFDFLTTIKQISEKLNKTSRHDIEN